MKESVGEWNVFSLFKKKEGDEDIYVDDLKSEEDFSEEESEIEAIDEMEDELEERRESALKRFFKKLHFFGRRSRRYEDDDEDGYDDYDEENDDSVDDLEDIKEVIKITHKWLERLPPEDMARFKRSEDFEKYKAVLRRLGMIK